MASSIMENNSGTSLALSDEESDCQPLEGHAFDVVHVLAFNSTEWTD